MGNEESILSNKSNEKSTELVWNDLFSLQYINELFKKITNQDFKNIFDTTLDSVFFSTLIENLISSKTKTYQFNIHSELEKSFFLQLIHDIEIDHDHSQIFTKCFDEMRSTANTILEHENTSRKNNNEYLVNSFHSIQTQKTETNFLEDFFAIPFNSLLPFIHVLEVPELASSLNNLNNILSDQKDWSLDNYESSITILIQKLIKKICQVEKFRVPEILILIIKFLFNFANVHGNVNSILSILQTMLSFPFDFTSDFDQLNFNLKGPKPKSKNLFTFPFEIDSKIISFSIGSNVLVLAEGIGLIQFIEPEPLIIPVNLCEDSILLDAYQFIYIFSIKLGTIQCFTNNDINIQSVRFLNISKYINIKHKILACGKFDQNIAILQNYGANKYRITIFNNNLEQNPNKVSEIKFTLNNEEENQPKFYYFSKSEVHIIYDNMVNKSFKILNKNETDSVFSIESMPDLICSSFIADNCPVGSFRQVLYSISQNSGKILFIKNKLSLKTKLKELPFTFTSVNLPIFNSNNIMVAISLIINELTSYIDTQLQYLLENRFVKYISFFVGPDNSTIEICLSLINDAINNENIDTNIKMPLISLLIKIITINLISYCIKFSKNMKSFADKDKFLFNQIKELIDLVTFSKYAEYSPLIIESVSILISTNFHYLYYPDFSTFSTFIQKVLSKKSIRHHLILNFMFLSTKNCFLYLFTKESVNIFKEEINDVKGFEKMFNNSLLLINNELQFLSENGIKSNEEFILPYFDFLLSYISENATFSSQLIQNLIFRLMLIDDFPLIALNIVDKSIPIISKFIEAFKKDNQFIEDDKKYSDNENVIDNEFVVFESKHNVEPKMETSKEIKFEKTNIIHLSFDKRCQTDPNDSSLKIYDISGNKNLLYTFCGDYWIEEIDIVSNSIQINFNNQSESDKYWGYKVTCSPKQNKKQSEFKPYLNLFYFNLLMNTLGKLTLICLQSIPPSVKEIECKFILEGDLLEGVTKVFNQKEIQIQLQAPELKTNNKPLTRGLSAGISFDATNGAMKYPDELKKEFINDLIMDKNREKETIASCLLKFMYKSVKAPHLIKPNPSILLAEKYMIAALMKQLGFINSAISFATRLISNDNEDESFVVPPNLDRTWKSIYRMRTLMYRSYQKSKEKIISQKKNDNENIKLREDFDSFINEIIIKCKFLLFTEPILKKRHYETENYDMETIEKTINELLSFITSELLMENLSRMVEKRTQKIKIRTQALLLMKKMIQSEIKEFKTTQISYLYPLQTSLKLLADHSDVKSAPNEMIDELNDILFDLFGLITSMITDPNETDSTRLFYIRMISVNIDEVVQTSKIVPLYQNVAKFIHNSSIQSIESFVTVSCLWRILGLWTLEFPSSEIVDSLLSFSTNYKNDFCQYHSILLLSALLHPYFYSDQIKITIDQIFKCFTNASPRVVVATFIWLSSFIVNSNDKFINEYHINGIKYDSNSFINFLLKAIGSSLCGGPCLFIPDDSMHESHMIVAEEIIAFLRILLSPTSKMNLMVNRVFHNVLSSSLNLVLTKKSQKDDIYKLIAVFTVLGKEVVSFHNSGYSILHTKEMTEIVRVTSYDSVSGQLKFIMANNSSNEITADKKTSKFVPSSRIPSNPNNFFIKDEEAKLFVSFQNEINSVLDKLSSIKFSILSASFIGFLTVCLQNERNAATFIKNADLLSFLSCTNNKKNLKKAAGIESLINRINSEINSISNAKNRFPFVSNIQLNNKKLPYSLVFHYDSPQQFIPLTDGKVDQYRLYTYASKSSLFVGDCSLPNTAVLYFEVKIVSFSSKNIGIGFIDHRSTQETVRIFGIGMKTESIFGNELMTSLKSGDVIGCEYSAGTIFFFYNGIKLKHSIPASLLDEFTPAIGTRDCEAIFEYNFGHKEFVTDLKERMEEEILRDSFEEFDVKIPNYHHIQIPKSNSFDNEEYDSFIKNGNAIWEIAKIHPNEENAVFKNSHTSLKNDQNAGTLGEISPIRQISAHFKFHVGEPVQISFKKEKPNDSPFDSLSLTGQLNLYKIGIITDVIALKNDPNLFLLTIETVDPMRNKKSRFQISSQYVTPISSKFMKIVENGCRIYIEKNASSKEEETFINSIIPVYLRKHKSNLFNITRSLIIKMCRFLSLIFIDFYRLNDSLPSYFDTYNPISNNVFSLLISDAFKFIHKPKISPKWSQYRLSDSIFTDENEQVTNNVEYLCLCNTHMLTRCIRALIYQNNEAMDSVLVNLASNSMEQITNAPNSSRDGIYNLVSKNFIIESPHPLSIYSIKQTIPMPFDSTGFIPVIHSLTSIGKNKVKINGHEFKNMRDFDYSIFPQKECSIEFKSNSDTGIFGLRLCLFPIKLHLNEKMAESSLGGIHILFTLLSAIFSDKKTKKEKDGDKCIFEKTEKYLKQEVIPRIASLMNRENFFVDLFAFEIIQPILMNLRWNPEDVSTRFEDAFRSFTAGLHQEIQKWEPLHNRAQQGLLISLFTRLLILEISTGTNQCKTENEIAYLYDTYIKSKIQSNSSVYDQMTEAVATCVALGSEMPISIKFPAFLIAEKWAENVLMEIDVVFENLIENLTYDHLNDVTLEFKKDESIPPKCLLMITDPKMNSQKSEEEDGKTPSNLRRANAINQLNDESANIQYEREFQEFNSTKEEKSMIMLKPGDKIKIKGSFSAQLVNEDGSIINDQSNKIHLIIKGYPCTHESKRSNFVSHFLLFKQHVSILSTNWDVRYDECLSRVIKNNPNIYTEFSPEKSDNLLIREPLLSLLPVPVVACRLYLFHRLEQYMPELIKVVDIGRNETILGGVLSSCRSAISTTFKLGIVKDVVERDIQGDGSPINVRFNRFQASLFHSKPENPMGKPLLDQLIDQVPRSSLSKMKRQGGAPWKVDLVGEGATDAGGPGRDLFTEACMELMDQSLRLFIPNPNKRVNNSNGNQELLIPNPQAMTDQTKNRFLYAGVLIGLCYISSIPEPFKFPRFFWDFLTNKQVSIDDIYEVDLQFKQLMTSVENCEKTLKDPSQFSDIFALTFQVQNSLGEMVDLVPGGSCIFVTFQKRLEFVQRCKAYRVKEFNDQLTLIREGFNIVFPSSAASILTPWEIELLICGDNKCPLEELKKHCSYEENDPHIEMLWGVLEKFSPEERMLFIKFGCGRMGLPPPGMKWRSKLNIKFREFQGIPDSLMPLPTAVTCNSKVTIPRYNDSKWMEKKIRTAITMGADIDQDRNARIIDLENVT